MLIIYFIDCVVEKYDYVGQLLKPGEVPHEYTDTEDENAEKSEAEKKTDWPHPGSGVHC